MRHKLQYVLLLVVIGIISSQFAASATQYEVNQPIELIIDLNGTPISEATSEDTPILYDQNEFKTSIICKSNSNESIFIEEVKTTFIIADIDIINKREAIEKTVLPYNNMTFIQTWRLNNGVLNQNFALISGIYKVRYDIKYSIGEETSTSSSTPFYIDFNVNPIKSVLGLVTTLTLITTTLSTLSLINTIKKGIPNEIESSSTNAMFKPSSELRSFYKETGFSKLQSEFTTRTFGITSRQWRNDVCPNCGTEWVEESDTCSNCGITLKEAEELHSNNIIKKALNVGKEIAESVDGLSFGEILLQLGDNITPTTDILELLTFSGLAIAEPRLSKDWNKKTRDLLFKTLQWTLYSLFWINTCGISAISLVYLGIAIISSTLIPLIINKIYSDKILKQASMFWKRDKL